VATDLVVAPEAQHDLMEAYAWYERRRVGLGEEFLRSVDASVEDSRSAEVVSVGPRELSAVPNTALSVRYLL